MATALAHSPFVSVEEYLRSDYEPDAEYVDGEIEERPMGQFDHASWQQALQRWFLEHIKEWNVRVLPEYRLRITKTRYRVPDVTVWDRDLPVEQILTHAPIAVFEVLSPEDRVPRMLRKLGDYAQMGVRTIVVINPDTDTVYRFQNGVLTPEEPSDCAGSLCRMDWQRIRELRD